MKQRSHVRDLGGLSALALLLFSAFIFGYYGQDIEASVRTRIESGRGADGMMRVGFTGSLDGVLAAEAMTDGVLANEELLALLLEQDVDAEALSEAVSTALSTEASRTAETSSNLADSRGVASGRGATPSGAVGDLLWVEEAYSGFSDSLASAAATVSVSESRAVQVFGLLELQATLSGETQSVDQSVRRLAGRVQGSGPYLLPGETVQRVLWDESGRRLARFGSSGSGSTAAQNSVYARLRTLLNRKPEIGSAAWPDEADAVVARVLRVGVGAGSRGPVTVEARLSVPGWELVEPEYDIVLEVSAATVSVDLEGSYRGGEDLAARIVGELEGNTTPDGMIRAQGRYEFAQQGARSSFTESGNAYLVGLRTRYDTYLGSVRLEADGAEPDRDPPVVLWRSDDAEGRRR